MHVMIYVLTYSRTSKVLSLGELIRAFYIIIYTTYIIILECYWKYYITILHVLDDFGHFHTKSLFLVFNIREAENLLFLVFIVSGATGIQMEKGKLHGWFYTRRTTVGRRLKEEEPRGPKEGGAHAARCFGRVGPTKWSLGHFLVRGFLSRTPSPPKTYALIFPRPSEAAAPAKPPDSLRRGSDPAASELRRRGKSSSPSSPLLLGVGGGLSIITITKTSTISIIIFVIHSVPLVV